MRTIVAMAAGILLAVGVSSCGSDSDGGCPGRICSNCASSDCDLTCPNGQIQVCESAANTGGSADLRCTYCEPL